MPWSGARRLSGERGSDPCGWYRASGADRLAWPCELSAPPQFIIGLDSAGSTCIRKGPVLVAGHDGKGRSCACMVCSLFPTPVM